MLTLEINNSISKITGLNKKEHSSLKEKLSYCLDPKISFYTKNFRSNKRYLIDKYGHFPTGLLYIVEKFLHNKQVKIIDHRVKPVVDTKHFKPIKLPHEPYQEQKDAVAAAIEHSRGIICAPTGVGKSVIAALIVNALKVKTLIVVPSLELKRQLTEVFKYYFDPKLVGKLGHFIAIENVDALDPNEVIDYHCVIIDEFHHSGSKTYRKLNNKAWGNVYYKFGLTATPFRNQSNERLLLESVLSKVIYKITYSNAVLKNYIVPVEAYYIELPKVKNTGNRWQQVYSDLVVNNTERNKIIAKLLNTLYNSGVSTLCLVKEIKHGENLKELISKKIPFVKGENDNNKEIIEQFNSKKTVCLIGTTGVIGEGVDTKPTEYVIIAGLGKSKGQFMQQVGRGVRRYKGKTSCKVVLFKDESHKWTSAHFKEQVAFLAQEYGILPVKLDLT